MSALFLAEEGRANSFTVMQGLGRKAVVCQPGSIKEFIYLQRGTGPMARPPRQGEKQRNEEKTSWKSADCQLPLTLASNDQRGPVPRGPSVCAWAQVQAQPAARRQRDEVISTQSPQALVTMEMQPTSLESLVYMGHRTRCQGDIHKKKRWLWYRGLMPDKWR